MSRRRMITILSAALLLGLLVVAALIVVSATQSAYGREKIRALVTAQISSAARGKWHVGKVSGGLFSGFEIDSLEIRDADDSLFLASGPVRLRYDFRDIFDRRVLLESLEIERLVLNLTQHSRSEWNFDRLFRKTATPKGMSLERRFEDFISGRNVVITDGTLRLSEVWQPDSSLTGARLDSAVEYQLARDDAEIVRVGKGFSRVRRFTDMQLRTAIRWTHPDTAGRFFDFQRLDVLSSDPPLKVSDARGTVLVVADSVWINLRQFSLPGSTARATGTVTTGSDLPARYAIKIYSDSVSLADVNWVYAPLPVEGGGSVDISIHNDPQNLRIMEYELTSLDLRTTASHIRGAITFGVGGDLLRMTDINLDASPLDFRFIERMGSAPLPVPWKGQFVGHVRGRGGPVNRFVVEELDFIYADANIPLAMSAGTGSGELDITRTSETIFRGFDVDFRQLDLRTFEFLFPSFPRVGGTLSGRARLDSLWHDVRFSQSDFQLHQGANSPSRFTGDGRITSAVPLMVFDLNLQANPVNFATFAHGYPGFPLRGEMSGAIAARGMLDQMNLDVNLRGAAGAFTFAGVVDNSPPGYSMRGRGTATALDLQKLLGRADLPVTRLSGAMDGALSGDSLANLRGEMVVRADSSSVERLGITSSRVALRFGEGRVYVDSAVARTSVGTIVTVGRGALGLRQRTRDSLLVRLNLTSPGILPGFISAMAALGGAKPASAAGSLPAATLVQADSLGGRLSMDAAVTGALVDPDVVATLSGSALQYGTYGARRASGEIVAVNLFSKERGGVFSVNLDSAMVESIGLSTATGRLSLERGASSEFLLEGRTHEGAHALLRGHSVETAGVNRIVLDSLNLALSSNSWQLASPAVITGIAGGYSIESLELRGDGGARFSAAGVLATSGAMDLRFVANRIPLLDIERMAGIRTRFEGLANMELRATGTRASPEFALDASVDSLGIADVRMERALVSARYANRQLSTNIGLDYAGERAVSLAAQLPLDLRLERVAKRVPDEPMSGRIAANNVRLGVLEAIFPQIRESEGTFSSNVSITGTVKQPLLSGPLTITASKAKLEGLGLQLRGLNADIDFHGDSAVVRRFSTGYDGGGPGDTASVSGFVSFRDYTNPGFNINFFANDFRVIQLPRVADLYVNSGLRLVGNYSSSALSGFVNVDRGALYIPELAQKRLAAIAEIDSALLANRAFAPPVPSALLENLELRNVRVAVGDQVWLRSAESNASIQIGGEVSMTSVRVPRPGSNRDIAELPRSRPDSMYRLALEGTLNADRGEYRLDMGVVQRKFQVEPGGTLTFFGEPELNPTLNISALHVVRGVTGQDAGRDVRIRVRLLGSLSDYQLVIESADGLDLSPSDLISYLVTGSPSFELGAAGDANLRTAASILLPSIGTWLGDRVVGGRFDSFQLDLALGQDERLSDFGQVFKRARVGVGKQIGSRTFLSANTNFCQIGGILEGQSASTEDLIQSIGLKLERRLNNGFSMALSAEPSTDALRCSAAGSSVRRVISSPPQLGFDLFKIWRF